ncbi:hypothetical protein P692DRAFT_20819712 [Suillus brevipes Sb2]|nr:hypothetical protein P692DRAFT_20819712 [Suillus brevipes Sb2]
MIEVVRPIMMMLILLMPFPANNHNNPCRASPQVNMLNDRDSPTSFPQQNSLRTKVRWLMVPNRIVFHNQDSTTSLRVTDKPDLNEENEIRRDAREAILCLKSVVSGHVQPAAFKLALAINGAGDPVAAVDNTTPGRCSERFSSTTHFAEPFILRQGSITMVSLVVSKAITPQGTRDDSIS